MTAMTAVTAVTAMTAMAAIDEAAFEAHFAQYTQSVACKAIGDSGQYTKHVQRRCAEGDAAALAQTAATEFFAGLDAEVFGFLEEMRGLGQDRIARVCDAVCQYSMLPFPRVHRWGLCALTGMPTESVLDVKGGEGELAVAPDFEAFATALWLVKHMWVLEKNRAAAFANKAEESATIASIVTAYCAHEAHAAAAATYLWAFRVALGTLRATRARLDAYVGEVARVRGV